MATPTLPTSPSARGWSESKPICVGRSKAHDSPVCPAASRNLNRWFVDSAVPNPAYWRIVHSRPRYIDAVHAPRVGRLSRHAEGGRRVPAGEVVGRVERLDLDAGVGAADVVGGHGHIVRGHDLSARLTG